ncbi:AMP-binding protein [Dactylosporangium sp. CA-233914]|uniref:AMP-binding protein n=1 Tax=Dactylosporangium sp. CA-233914 TaxID=3239934 RepID=UPI003D91BFE3
MTTRLSGTETLSGLLAEAVRQWPRRTFLRIDGRDTTYSEFDGQVAALAGALAEQGLRRGDRLVVFMRNSLACVQTWFAANRLGAVWVPVNTEWRGGVLARAIALANPRLLVVDRSLLAPLDEAGAPSTETGEAVPILVAEPRAGANGDAPDLRHLLGAAPVFDPLDVRPADTAGMLYTSGSTGRSKACVLSNRYFSSQAAIAIRDFGLRGDDVLYCPYPLFHADATALTVVPALMLGATAAIGQRFSASRFWSEVRQVEATVFDFMGATLSILHKAAPKPDDADNPVRLAWGVPLPDWAPDFERRFGLQLLELYGSVEANLPITQHWSAPRVPGSCGRQNEDFETLVVDEDDEPVQDGAVGELIIRPRRPFTMFNGYFADPEATMSAARNLWFHSGDLVRRDAQGNYFFVGRKKDVIRRRGENISAFEVEEALMRHSEIRECAAIGVTSELTEEDVKVLIVRAAGSSLTEVDVWTFASHNLGRFQLPRYVELVDALPRTPTGKIDKVALRTAERVPGRVWDREAHPAQPQTTEPSEVSNA